MGAVQSSIRAKLSQCGGRCPSGPAGSRGQSVEEPHLPFAEEDKPHSEYSGGDQYSEAVGNASKVEEEELYREKADNYDKEASSDSKSLPREQNRNVEQVTSIRVDDDGGNQYYGAESTETTTVSDEPSRGSNKSSHVHPQQGCFSCAPRCPCITDIPDYSNVSHSLAHSSQFVVYLVRNLRCGVEKTHGGGYLLIRM